MLAGEKYWQKWKGHARAQGLGGAGVGMDRFRDRRSTCRPAASQRVPRRRGRTRVGAMSRRRSAEPPRCARGYRRTGARIASGATGRPGARRRWYGDSGRSSAGLAPLVRRRAGPLVSAAETLKHSIRLTVDRVGEVAGGRCVGLGANFLARSRVRAHGFSDPPAGALQRAGHYSSGPERPVCLLRVNSVSTKRVLLRVNKSIGRNERDGEEADD